jgi:molybdopterin-guanine dinucleotide biosynthesis protein A
MKKFGTVIILAGGKSSRMGYNKELIRVNGEKIIKSQIKRLSNIFEEIIVVTNNVNYYLDVNCITASDEIVGRGPLSGIHAGLLKARSKYSYVIACDMPIINIDYIYYQMRMLSSRDHMSCITKLGDYIEPFNAFYSREMIGHIEEYLGSGKQSVHGLVKSLDCLYIPEKVARRFSPNWEMFSNFNTKEDIKNYMKCRKLECL